MIQEKKQCSRRVIQSQLRQCVCVSVCVSFTARMLWLSICTHICTFFLSHSTKKKGVSGSRPSSKCVGRTAATFHQLCKVFNYEITSLRSPRRSNDGGGHRRDMMMLMQTVTCVCCLSFGVMQTFVWTAFVLHFDRDYIYHLFSIEKSQKQNFTSGNWVVDNIVRPVLCLHACAVMVVPLRSFNIYNHN